jgi:4-hydroxy-4-methyl-2-oxoglutarate aldolase
MITDPPILKIRRAFARPAAELVAAFAGAATGHVVDAMSGSGAVDFPIKPLAGTPSTFHGVALPCSCGPADNLALFGALDCAKPGDVILAATGGHMGCSVAGDLVIGMAKNCGVVAFVTDGLVRDVAGIVAVGLPVFAAGVSPNSPVRNGPGTVGLSIILGGVAIQAGDIVVADSDGVVIVPQRIAADVVAKLEGVRRAEAAVEARVKGGARMLESVASLLRSDRVEELP